ncbi:hypothetical protein C8R47DRAFT_1007875 [Mycena vitilis]|nr:hypothetical protein C8R47DRAFT_1007875 [Mycena vitilis]
MGAAVLRQRVIDDTDSALQYSGWAVADPTTLTAGNEGPIYLGTSHVATGDSTVTFPFNGTAIRALGTVLPSTADNVTHPAWTCFVDQIKIPGPPGIQFAENNLQLCGQPEIASGSHVFSIEVQSKGGGALYLDHMKYTPPPDEDSAPAVLAYQSSDPSVTFSAGWSKLTGQSENGTNQAGSQVTLDFEGTSVILYGLIPASGYAHNSTWATYAIDGGSLMNFTLKGLPPQADTTQSNAILLTTPSIPSGRHKLVVTYGGDSAHTPLSVGEFFVTNTTSSIDTESSSSSSSALFLPSKSPAPILFSKKKVPGGIIAGSIIGAMVVLTLLVLAIHYQRRRRARDADQTSTIPYPRSMTDIETLGGTMSTSGPGTASTSGPGTVATPTRRFLPMKFVREQAAAAAAGHLSRDAQDPPNVVVVRYTDSGVRLHPAPGEEREVEEVEVVERPPGYSAS